VAALSRMTTGSDRPNPVSLPKVKTGRYRIHKGIEDRGLLAVADFSAVTTLEVAEHATVFECREC